MAFFQEHTTPTSQASRLATRLAESLRAAGLPVQSGAGLRWRAEFERLLSHHPPARVESVLDWLATRHRDRYTPQVRSAKSFRLKFLRLAAMAGLSFGVDDTRAAQLVDHQPLGWPFPADGEIAWLSDAMRGVAGFLEEATEADYAALGPPLHCLSTWRMRKNAFAWAVTATGFGELRWAADEGEWMDIMRECGLCE